MRLIIKARYVLIAALICLGAFGITVLISIGLFCGILKFLFELLGEE